MTNRISIDEQRQQGLRRSSPQHLANFVPASPRPVKVEVMPAHETHMIVEHPAKQEVIVTTNATDRAKGFQLMITPISLVVAVLAVLVSLLFENQFLSFASLLVFWLTFCVVYVSGWVLTALATPEFVSWYSARRQWDIIEREQQERWSYYRWQTGRDDDTQQPVDVPTEPGFWPFINRHLHLLLVAGLGYLGFVLLYLWWS